jgi:hypothetical protein
MRITITTVRLRSGPFAAAGSAIATYFNNNSNNPPPA